MPSLKGTKTEDNLKAAFAGEHECGKADHAADQRKDDRADEGCGFAMNIAGIDDFLVAADAKNRSLPLPAERRKNNTSSRCAPGSLDHKVCTGTLAQVSRAAESMDRLDRIVIAAEDRGIGPALTCKFHPDRRKVDPNDTQAKGFGYQQTAQPYRSQP